MTFFSRGALLLSSFGIVFGSFLIYYASTLLFRRKARSKRRSKTPPTVPYYLPGIYHAFSLAKTGPQKFFAQVIKDYGDGDGGLTPFFVNAGAQKLLVVRGPGQIAKVLRNTEVKPFGDSNAELFDKVLGSPQAAVELYAGKAVSDADRLVLEEAHISMPRKHLTGASLVANIEHYMSVLSENLNNKMFQSGSWTQIEDSWSFLQQIVSHCTLQSMFGSDLFKQYPSVVRDYWEFHDAMDGFIPGLPRYWVPSAASQARDRLLQGIEKWLKANHSGSEFARIGEEDPIWDEQKGSKFIQERDDLLARLEVMDLRARAAETLGVMHESCSTIIPSLLWSFVEILRRPDLARRLASNISRYSPSQGATYNVESLTTLPLIESIIAETVRLRIVSIATRVPKESLQLDENWVVSKDIPVLILSHDLSLNTAAWTKARPRTIEKPLDEYWAERFLMADALQRKHVAVPSFSMNGLEQLNINASNVSHSFLGWEYAKAIHASTLAVLLNEFEPQLCDPDLFDAVVPPARDIAFGSLKPLDQVAIRIRKRSWSKV